MYSQGVQIDALQGSQKELMRLLRRGVVESRETPQRDIPGRARSRVPESIAQLRQAQRDQKADHARLNDAIKNAEAEIALLNRENLSANEMGIAILRIRDRAILAVREVRRNMARRAAEAKNLLDSLTDDFFRERERFAEDDYADSCIRASQLANLERMPTYSLLDQLQDAIQGEDMARAELIRLEFQSRNDGHEYSATFAMLLAKLALSDPAEIRRRIAEIRSAAELADASIADLFHATR